MIYAIHGTAYSGKTTVADLLGHVLRERGRTVMRVDGFASMRNLVEECTRATFTSGSCQRVLARLIGDDDSAGEATEWLESADALCRVAVDSTREAAKRRVLGYDDESDEELIRLNATIPAALTHLAITLALGLPEQELVSRMVRLCLDLNSEGYDIVLDDPPEGVLDGLGAAGVTEREIVRAFIEADKPERVSRAFSRDGSLPVDVMASPVDAEAALRERNWRRATVVIDSSQTSPARVCDAIIDGAQMLSGADEPDIGMEVSSLVKEHQHTMTTTLSYFDETARDSVLGTLAQQYTPEKFILDVARTKGVDVSDPAAVLSFSMQSWTAGAVINSTVGPDQEPVLITLEDSGRDSVTISDVAVSLGEAITQLATSR